MAGCWYGSIEGVCLTFCYFVVEKDTKTDEEGRQLMDESWIQKAFKSTVLQLYICFERFASMRLTVYFEW